MELSPGRKRLLIALVAFVIVVGIFNAALGNWWGAGAGAGTLLALALSLHSGRSRT